MGMARRVTKNHYVAASPVGADSPVPVHVARAGSGLANRGYSTDGEDSQRAPSDRTVSEYTSVVSTMTLIYEHNFLLQSLAQRTDVLYV